MKRLIKNGLVYYQGKFSQQDILIVGKRISEIAPSINKPADMVTDATGRHVFPGFIDMHVHLRDPGQTHKEDIVTGSRAAARGGFTTICCMPNTEPVVDNAATVEYIKRKANDLGSCKVMVIGALTKKSEGKQIAETAAMIKAGIVAVSDDGHCVQNAKLKLNAMKYVSSFGLAVITHAEDYNLAGKGQINAGKVSTMLGLSGMPSLAEDIIVARDILLAKSAKCRLHLAHTSTALSLQMVRVAKEQGLRVTCEVTPHHLLLTEDACIGFDTNTKVKPPLRTESDRQACITALKDGTIDFIATDHAPHSDFEKEHEFTLAPYGINGLETAFISLFDRLVLSEIIPLEFLIEKMAVKPAEFLGLNRGVIEPGKEADIVIADLTKSTKIDTDNLLSKSKNTPFLGETFRGTICETIADGKTTWKAAPCDNNAG
ncbi:MAG: dihydroorotase [Candidatus Cloacimonetes bacterium]|nr:dihydroorotase [Candidatus Cloacimonadota bacterium]